jgi:F-type H+/Na+-transporting ATPase subunit alpha
MKGVAGTLKLDLAQFRELEAFATFGSELDAISKAQLERGYRLVELLKQPLNSPMPVEEQVVSIFAGTKGYLDDIAVSDVRRFENELLDFMRTRHGSVLSDLRSKKVGDDLAGIVQSFKDGFVAANAARKANEAASDAEQVGEAQSNKTLATE